MSRQPVRYEEPHYEMVRYEAPSAPARAPLRDAMKDEFGRSIVRGLVLLGPGVVALAVVAIGARWIWRKGAAWIASKRAAVGASAKQEPEIKVRVIEEGQKNVVGISGTGRKPKRARKARVA